MTCDCCVLPPPQHSFMASLRRPLSFAACCAFVALTGCNTIVHQTRYIPQASELTWEVEHKQLPWRPPALGENHYPRRDRPAKPQFAPEIDYDIQRPQNGYRFANDGLGIPAR